MGHSSHPLVHVWQVVGPSQGVPWSLCPEPRASALQLLEAAVAAQPSAVEPSASHATSAQASLHGGLYVFPRTTKSW